MTTKINLPQFKLPRHQFFKRKRVVIRQGTPLVLTPLGKQKTNNFGLEGSKFDVLTTIADEGPCTISEIANRTGHNDSDVQRIVRSLVQSGYVRVASSEE